MSDSDWRGVLAPMLAAAGVMSPIRAITPLTGGVSSDIVRVELDDGRMLCAKRALAKLKVASDWSAPIERNRYEVAWLRLAGSIVPNRVPAVVADSEVAGVVVMDYLPEADFVLWKAELLGGHVDLEVATAVGATLGAIHAATWDDTEVAAAFATDHLIDALRLDPYLRFSASRHPEVAETILAILRRTATTRHALVHGDVSPKNILVRRSNRMPVFLDAECAWYGDPAFDAAFCINHLLLKAYHLPQNKGLLGAAASNLLAAWLGAFPEAERSALAFRTATLLPCLLLARIDGKSPVEYLSEPTRAVVRAHALDLLRQQPASLGEIIDRSIARTTT
jgi:aminoglycoside phosphotransferase (APT) family kinase protein